MSTHNPNELHEERLATTDEAGHRVFLYPEDVHGKWRNRRDLFYWFLISIYLILPWINVDGKQSILLDIAKREFIFFGYSFYAHHAPLVIFLLLGFVFTIGFITSIWGRLWCGWACPQTVFIDTIFRNIELLVEGNARRRKKLDDGPLNIEKAIKKIIKWALFTAASLHIAHSFIGYFVGARKLFYITMSPPSENMTIFIITMTASAIVLFDFGWFREQFCIIACPYGRMQSVMMDDNSMIIAYDKKRGEPRRGKDIPKDQQGDCVDCYACVKACPTGIDIRRGTQLECIACTNCIDACDDIMDRIKKPKGLIRYSTENALSGKEVKIFRPRNVIYLLAIVAIFFGLVFSLQKSRDLSVSLLRGSNTPYKVIEKAGNEIEIMNHFKVVLDSPNTEKLTIDFRIKDEKLRSKIKLITPIRPYKVKNTHTKVNVFFRFQKDVLTSGNRKVTLEIIQLETNKVVEQEVNLVGPLK